MQGAFNWQGASFGRRYRWIYRKDRVKIIFEERRNAVLELARPASRHPRSLTHWRSNAHRARAGQELRQAISPPLFTYIHIRDLNKSSGRLGSAATSNDSSTDAHEGGGVPIWLRVNKMRAFNHSTIPAIGLSHNQLSSQKRATPVVSGTWGERVEDRSMVEVFISMKYRNRHIFSAFKRIKVSSLRLNTSSPSPLFSSRPSWSGSFNRRQGTMRHQSKSRHDSDMGAFPPVGCRLPASMLGLLPDSHLPVSMRGAYGALRRQSLRWLVGPDARPPALLALSPESEP